MLFPAPLIPATLVRRYKRFLADVILPDGTETTVHAISASFITRQRLARATQHLRRLLLPTELE